MKRFNAAVIILIIGFIGCVFLWPRITFLLPYFAKTPESARDYYVKALDSRNWRAQFSCFDPEQLFRALEPNVYFFGLRDDIAEDKGRLREILKAYHAEPFVNHIFKRVRDQKGLYSDLMEHGFIWCSAFYGMPGIDVSQIPEQAMTKIVGAGENDAWGLINYMEIAIPIHLIKKNSSWYVAPNGTLQSFVRAWYELYGAGAAVHEDLIKLRSVHGGHDHETEESVDRSEDDFPDPRKIRSENFERAMKVRRDHQREEALERIEHQRWAEREAILEKLKNTAMKGYYSILGKDWFENQ